MTGQYIHGIGAWTPAARHGNFLISTAEVCLSLAPFSDHLLNKLSPPGVGGLALFAPIGDKLRYLLAREGVGDVVLRQLRVDIIAGLPIGRYGACAIGNLVVRLGAIQRALGLTFIERKAQLFAVVKRCAGDQQHTLVAQALGDAGNIVISPKRHQFVHRFLL